MAKSVFYDIVDTPEEAANLSARSVLMIAIEQKIRKNGWTQSAAAKELGVRQPRVSDLMNGKIDKFSLDALVNMLPAVGLKFIVQPAQPEKPQAPSNVSKLVGQTVRRNRPPAKAPARRLPAAAAGGAKEAAARAVAKTSKPGGTAKSKPRGTSRTK